MKWFKSVEPTVKARPPVAAPKPQGPVVSAKPAAAAKPPVVEGWSEGELVAVYNAAPVKNLKKGESIFNQVEYSDSFFVLLDGAIEVVVKWDGHSGRPGIFQRSDVVAPLPSSPGLRYCAEAAVPSTVIEITPAVMKHLADKTQLSIYKLAVASTSKINAYIRAVNGEISSKNKRLTDYIISHKAGRAAAIESEFVQNFLRNMPQMPAYATDLAVKLLDDHTSVQEVVEGIKRDPNLVGVVLKTVNSPLYGFGKKIESFYHACMILGFNNIYNLIMREAAQSTMPVTRETTKIHKHSCLISVLCFEIASVLKEQQLQTLTTIGLLHDIGKGVQVVMKAKHPDKANFIDTFESAKLGAELLRMWGLPERICNIVEFQQYPEFTAPDLISPEHRRETGTVHIAHILELLLVGQPIDPTRSIYTRDYMAVLGFPNLTPEELLKDRVLPNLLKNKSRIPPEIQSIFTKPPAANEKANASSSAKSRTE
jgi:putative nucleotidyltransferase with HDIG domain